MKTSLSEHIGHLKSAILTLPATGEKGFEGLIGEALREIAGVPYRLARSGSQSGIDGKAGYESDAICFEGKLYKDRPDRTDVIAKIAEAAMKRPDTDVWVLGTTADLGVQLADDTRELGADKGLHVLILDWAGLDLPPLAAALAMGGTRVRDFLKAHIRDGTEFQRAETALEVVRSSKDFSPHADRIRAECDAPSVGLALARKANTALLSDTFSSRAEAKRQFGQPLAPGDTDNVTIRQRRVLIEQIQSYITATPGKTVAFVLGEEGCGKSWAVAQSWLNLEPKPLMLLLTPIDLPDASQRPDVDELLITNLIRQTGETDASPEVRRRWSRRLKQWRSSPAIDGSRIIVVLDGINQRPVPEWARIIDLVANEVFKLGGCLIVTDRSDDFRYRVEPRLDSSMSIEKITVPAWTEPERNKILEISGVRPASLRHSVLTQLLNPRLLGIALELLRANAVTTLEELTVSRLLFEHIRNSERDSLQQPLASETARTLQECAQDFLTGKNGQRHDLAVRDDIQAVAEGRFFRMVDGDPNRIVLRDEGIVLALGFLVIEQLRDASRNDQDLGDKVNEIFEPLASLDNMADVVFAALTVASVDTRFGPDEIVTALIKGFVALQNVSQANFPAFADLAKHRLKSFMDAAQAICLSGRYQPNFDWLQGALSEVSRDGQYWPLMIDRIYSWLSSYSLSPERGILRFPVAYQQQRAQDKLEKKRIEIEGKLQSLTSSEQEILKAMPEEDGDLNRLSRLALLLLAGKPLASFTRGLMNWSFSSSLNPDHETPYKEFRHLVSLNRIDWAQTRKALLSESTLLRGEDVSSTGKWALVTILRATGHSDDGEEAEFLVENLTKGRPRPESWRRIETYCASDPCDPVSEKPDNVVHTAKQYGEIDVSKLHIAMGPTSEDHFWNMARPGMARFEPKAAVAKHRELVTNVLHRTGFSLRQGLFELRKHAALISIEDAQELVKRRTELRSTNATADLSKEDAWIVSQYHFLLAFPLLSAKEQAAILLASEKNEKFLLELFRIAKPLSEKAFESLLKAACSDDDERGQFLLLQLGYYTSVPLSRGARKRVATLIRSKSDRVRTFALGVIAQSGDEELLNKVVKSNWMATDAKTKTYWETWFGSMALLEAASQGLIAHENAVSRISARMYGRAAAMLNERAAHDIACRIDASINHVAGLDSDFVAPDIELQVDPSSPCEPAMLTINERPLEAKDLAIQMSLLLDDDEAFEQRQRRSHDAFREFEANLTRAEARIILDDLGLEGFAAVVTAAGKLADRWHGLFMSTPDDKLPSIHNLVLWLAHSLARKQPQKAEMLFHLIRNCKPVMGVTFGRAGVQLDAMATWAGIRNPVLDDLRFGRLNQASTDHELALEVLAALLNSKQDSLTAYIEAKLTKQEPAEVARGIMVAGFSDQSKFNDKALASYQGSAGLIGNAQEAAKYAYERNIWARHWFELMTQTDDREDFWRHSVLFSKIVDGRFDVWRSDYTKKGSPIQLFGFSLGDAIKRRMERWKANRSKTLFGLDAPAPIFLRGTNTGT